MGKNLAANAGESGLIPGLGRSSGVGNGYPLTPAFLQGKVHGQRWATVHGVAKSLTQLSMSTEQTFEDLKSTGLAEISQSVSSLSRVQLFATPWTAARQASLSVTNSWSFLKLMSSELVMPSKHLLLCCPPALNLSQHQGLFQ